MIMKKILTNGVFQTTINNNGIYIDKTKMIQQLIEDESACFLARPRRFWKTFTIQTIIEIWKWNKDLFKDTYIWKSWYKFEVYPVLFLDLTNYNPKDIELRDHILRKTYLYYGNEKINFSDFLKENNYKMIQFSFFDMIEIVNKHFNKKVIVLVDEYDKPILENIQDEKRLEEDYNLLSSFYPWLKEWIQLTKMIFVSGLSKIFQQHTYSWLNMLTDLTYNINYYSLVWFTEQEIKKNFSQQIKEFADNNWWLIEKDVLDYLHKECDWYNFWNPTDTIFNSWAVMQTLQSKTKDFSQWSQTGTVTFVAKLMKEFLNIEWEKKYAQLNIILSLLINGWGYLYNDIKNYKIKNWKIYPTIDTILLSLFYAGYLTLKKENNNYYYIIPNNDALKWLKGLDDDLAIYSLSTVDKVSISFLENFIDNIFSLDKEKTKIDLDIIFKSFFETTNSLVFIKNNNWKWLKEKELQLSLWSIFKLTKYNVEYEFSWIIWRADLVLFDKNSWKVLIIELKSFDNTPIDTVLSQWLKYVSQVKTKLLELWIKNITDDKIRVMALSLQNNWFDFKITKI